jgi:hypothetical protein
VIYVLLLLLLPLALMITVANKPRFGFVNGKPHLGRRNALNITCNSLSQYHMQQAAEQVAEQVAEQETEPAAEQLP